MNGQSGGDVRGGRGQTGGVNKEGGFVNGNRSKASESVAGVSAQDIATYLGLTTEQLKANLDAGESLSQIAVAQGKTAADLQTFLVQKATAEITAALTATQTTKSGSGQTGGASGNGANATPATGTTTMPSAAATPTS